MIYRPPKENLELYNQFIEEFAPILGNLEINIKDVTLADDFNIDLLKKYKTNMISEYFNMLTSNSFYPKITEPTFGTLIDNFLCKLTDNTINNTSGILIKKGFLTINLILPYLTISSPKILLQCMSKLQKRMCI